MVIVYKEKKKVLKNDREHRSSIALRKNLHVRKKQAEALFSKVKILNNEDKKNIDK